ncbi:hypothetical protein IWX49DRAFT_409849 [Phyllosticta citricarpa]
MKVVEEQRAKRLPDLRAHRGCPGRKGSGSGSGSGWMWLTQCGGGSGSSKILDAPQTGGPGMQHVSTLSGRVSTALRLLGAKLCANIASNDMLSLTLLCGSHWVHADLDSPCFQALQRPARVRSYPEALARVACLFPNKVVDCVLWMWVRLPIKHVARPAMEEVEGGLDWSWTAGRSRAGFEWMAFVVMMSVVVVVVVVVVAAGGRPPPVRYNAPAAGSASTVP